jgi:hypothetical protein
VVAEVSKKLAVNKQAAQKCNVKRFNLRKLSELEVRKEYQIKIADRFAALENLNGSKDINRVWKSTKENIKTSAKESLTLHELQRHKPSFGEECLHFLDQRRQAEMQWLQDPNQNNANNLIYVKREDSKHFGGGGGGMEANIVELETNSKTKKITETCTGASMT